MWGILPYIARAGLPLVFGIKFVCRQSIVNKKPFNVLFWLFNNTFKPFNFFCSFVMDNIL
ncbi:Hypothetical protein I595_2146 [Croceitalea dokdonensis DOKDO 023]|uniref:Uncharacterized protein n=1 Tax=Croceitalea dokdonensis DOKDO 023 TaxID=1300341 RepID=A0A0P7ATA8_9FLAO|nr:Hypothetical protein I595_2146 [Croceitalea dokdonensis DOKDO 023]